MLNFTLIKLTLCVIVGILLESHFQFRISEILFPGMLILVVFCLAYYRAGKLLFQDFFFGISTYLIFLFLGIMAASIHLPQNRPAHYINHLTEETSPTPNLIIAEVSENLKPGSYQDKYIVHARRLNNERVKGKILLNVTRDSVAHPFEIGKSIAIAAANITPVNMPLNPYQFNYAEFMTEMGVLRQVNVSPGHILPLQDENVDMRSMAGSFRNTIISNLRKYKFHPDELAIIQALLLGQRQEISQEIYSNYAAAGVIHILAVSGLHVGIILLLLNRLLKPVEYLPKGKFFKAILLLILLWSFAILAGLSPSVVRAVSMFSFVAIGIQINRPTSVLNTLFISLLVLLLINPGFLFQVGFQLSYAAVFSIVLIQPHLFALYKGKSRWIKYFWGILTVTFAAQIGVLPLSLFYFHQFPGLFFISNLVILPFLGIILGVGIVVMILSLLDILPSFLAEGFGKMITALNNFVAWVGTKEEFIFENVGFSLLLCITSYLIVIGFIWLLKKFRFKSLFFFLSTVIIFQAAIISEKFLNNSQEVLIFHKSRNTVIGKKQNEGLELYHNLKQPATTFSFIKDYITHENINEIHEQPLANLYKVENKLLLQIDSSGIYKVPGIVPDIILLTNSPKINLNRVLAELDPEIIIADGSNYLSYISRWKKTACNQKVPFHATAEKGAFIIEPSAKEAGGK